MRGGCGRCTCTNLCRVWCPGTHLSTCALCGDSALDGAGPARGSMRIAAQVAGNSLGRILSKPCRVLGCCRSAACKACCTWPIAALTGVGAAVTADALPREHQVAFLYSSELEAQKPPTGSTGLEWLHGNGYTSALRQHTCMPAHNVPADHMATQWVHVCMSGAP